MNERPNSTNEHIHRTVMEAIIARFRESFGDELRIREPMSRHTTVGLGGPADMFLTVRSTAELIEAVLLASKQHVDFWVMGAGSNVLVSDQGVRGLLIRNRAKHVNYRHDGSSIIVRAESGVTLSRLARDTASNGLAGLEWAVGIPGTIGGAVVGNAGAHGGDIATSLRSVSILDADLVVRDYRPDELEYGYRTSILKKDPSTTGKSNRIVLSAEFNLTPASTEELAEIVESIKEHRKHTQPPGASMGCMFKNPEGDFAGRLLEEAGLMGFRIGGAHISPVHANFFVNDDQATAEDVRELMAKAWRQVNRRFRIELEPEVELIGDWK
ncbi:MAG: UDP-N-acetylmuramate dehydrogenase [Chloroflexota bacterium]